MTLRVFPDPEASLLSGLLTGERSGITSDIARSFRIVGATHILALSGFNIILVVQFIRAVLRSMRVPIRIAFPLIIPVMLAFVVATGAASSLVRASIMAIVLGVGRYIGRPSANGNLFVGTAAVMTFIDPSILFFDVGFILSFFGLAGIIYAKPLFEQYGHRIPKLFGMRGYVLETFAAMVLIMPFVMWKFHQLTLLGLIANILILPLVAPAMLLGFFAVLVGFVWINAAQLLAWYPWLLLRVIHGLPERVAQLPFASKTISITWYAMIALYSVVFGWLIIERRRLNLKIEQ